MEEIEKELRGDGFLGSVRDEEVYRDEEMSIVCKGFGVILVSEVIVGKFLILDGKFLVDLRYIINEMILVFLIEEEKWVLNEFEEFEFKVCDIIIFCVIIVCCWVWLMFFIIYVVFFFFRL